MNKKLLGLRLALICVVSGYFGCGLLLQHGVAIPASFYWFFFLAIPSISFLLISNNEVYNVLLLIINSICVYSLYILQNTTWYPAGTDSQFELQIVSLVHNKGVWAPMIGTGYGPGISVHPAMHIYLASLCTVTGAQPYQVMFIVPLLKGVGFILFFYLFARNFLFNARIVFFASMACLGTVWYLDFPHRELFAEILFMGALWIYSRKKTGLEMKIVLVLLIFCLAMSHHFTSYIFLALVVALYLFQSKRRKKMINPLLPAVAVLSWMIFVSSIAATTYGTALLKALETVLTLRFPEERTFAAISYYYTPFESIIIFMNPILIGTMALSPFLKEMRSRKRKSLLAITFVLGFLLALSIFFFVFRTPAIGTAYNRIWGFAYVPLSVWASLFFWKKFAHAHVTRRTIMSMAIIGMLFASMNLSSMGSGIKRWYVPRGYMERYVYSDSMVNTAQWCSDHLAGTILGDNFAHDMVGAWGYKEVDQGTFNVWYQTKNNELLRRFDYIILSPWDTVTYSDKFKEPIDPFVLLPEELSIVYTSGDLVVYRNSNR